MKVIINAGGRTCTTVNPFGPEEPIESEYVDHSLNDGTDLDMCLYQDQVVEYNIAVNQWQKAQSERQTFEIEHECEEGVCSVEIPLSLKTRCGLIPGTTHEAEIVGGKAVIK